MVLAKFYQQTRGEDGKVNSQRNLCKGKSNTEDQQTLKAPQENVVREEEPTKKGKEML